MKTRLLTYLLLSGLMTLAAYAEIFSYDEKLNNALDRYIPLYANMPHIIENNGSFGNINSASYISHFDLDLVNRPQDTKPWHTTKGVFLGYADDQTT